VDWERYAKEEKRMCSDHLCGMRRRGKEGRKGSDKRNEWKCEWERLLKVIAGEG